MQTADPFSTRRDPVGQPASDPRQVFQTVVCGVDGSRSSREAVRQAVALAAPDAALRFVCIRASGGHGRLRQPTISARRADTALGEAMSLAAEAGMEASGSIMHADEPGAALVEVASASDLLVVSSHGGPRIGSLLLGSVALTAVHHADVPVLVARALPDAIAFPERILVASDGSADATRAVELASEIARSHDSRLYLLAAGLRTLRHADALGSHAAMLAGKTELEPSLLLKRGDPEEEIPRAAREERVALTVVGSRGLSGVDALGSVSKRVATDAPCSVLVARPTPASHREEEET